MEPTPSSIILLLRCPQNTRVFDEVWEERGSWRKLARVLLMYDKPAKA
jgi:hypothetical protein